MTSSSILPCSMLSILSLPSTGTVLLNSEIFQSHFLHAMEQKMLFYPEFMFWFVSVKTFVIKLEASD